VKRLAISPPGAPAQADVSDPYIQEIASAALVELDRRSNALYKQKIVRILNAQQQVCFVLICIFILFCSIVSYIRIT
jgi:hypothetical protein